MCVSCGCRGRSAPCVCRVVSCAVFVVAHGMRLMLGGRMGIREQAGCRGSSSSGGCAEQAGEPDESGLGRYVGMWSGWCRVCMSCAACV